ncbi:MAG: WD40/YVTN/BNR-like repeat-containing protein [Nitrospiraceae bacterium]
MRVRINKTYWRFTPLAGVMAAFCSFIVTLLGLPLSPSARSRIRSFLVNVQKSNTESTLLSIQFRTVQTGWAVGAGGTILKTTDGGKNWRKVSSGTIAMLTSVFFVDQQVG